MHVSNNEIMKRAGFKSDFRLYTTYHKFCVCLYCPHIPTQTKNPSETLTITYLLTVHVVGDHSASVSENSETVPKDNSYNSGAMKQKRGTISSQSWKFIVSVML